MKPSARVAVYPGTFDPVTNGHIDLIRRALRIFERVVVGVAVNPEKGTLFPVEERAAMLREATRRWPRVTVKAFNNLAVDFARKNGAKVILRGLRMLSDFEYEMQMSLTNRRINPDIETVFLMPSEEHSYISSRLIKEAAALGADVRDFIPARAAAMLRKRLAEA